MKRITLLAAIVAFSINAHAQTQDIKTVKIGNQTWTVENLNVDKFSDGEKIIEAKTNEEWFKAYNTGQPAWCYFNNDPNNGLKYGKLYNYWAFISPKGICPKGFHVPTIDEFKALLNLFPAPKAQFLGWVSFGNGSNQSGFGALPCGHRDGSMFASGPPDEPTFHGLPGDKFGPPFAKFWLVNLKDQDRFTINHYNPNIVILKELNGDASIGSESTFSGCSCRCLKN